MGLCVCVCTLDVHLTCQSNITALVTDRAYGRPIGIRWLQREIPQRLLVSCDSNKSEPLRNPCPEHSRLDVATFFRCEHTSSGSFDAFCLLAIHFSKHLRSEQMAGA